MVFHDATPAPRAYSNKVAARGRQLEPVDLLSSPALRKNGCDSADDVADRDR